MTNKVFVANFPFDTTEKELNDAFSKFGIVSDVKIITDKQTGRSKGFGFVTFEDSQAADVAIGQLSGTDFKGRKLDVKEEREQKARKPFNKKFNTDKYH